MHRKFCDDIFACFLVIMKNVISFIKEYRGPTLRPPCDGRHWWRHHQGWSQLHNINSNSNSNSRGFNSNPNSNSGQSPEYQLQLQLQLRRFQLQLQFQLRQISRISTPTPTPTPEVSTPTPIPTPEISTPIPIPTPEFQIQPQLHFKSNQSCSTKLPLPITMWNIVWIKWRYAVDMCHVVPNLDQHWHSRW